MRYFKVIKENPLWEVGAIISNTEEEPDRFDVEGEQEVFKLNDKQEEYLSKEIVENQPSFFQEVFMYRSLKDKVSYLTKDLFKKSLKDDNETLIP